MKTEFAFDALRYEWQATDLVNRAYVCGFCGNNVASYRGVGFTSNNFEFALTAGGVYICPNCNSPTAFDVDGKQFPVPAVGNRVPKIPKNLNALYEEARRCTATKCYTAAVLLCRKLLMNIAVEQKAKEGLRFIEYVEYLSQKGFVPPNGKPWVDHIRKKGNEATHEIALMTLADAKELIDFIEMLLRFIYEFPARVGKEAKPKAVGR